MGRAWAAAWVCCSLTPDLTTLRSQRYARPPEVIMGAERLAWEGMTCRGPGQALLRWQGGGGQSRGVVSRSSSPCVLDRNVPAGASVTSRYRGDRSGSWSLPNRRARTLHNTPPAEDYHIAGAGADTGSGCLGCGGLAARLPPSCVPVLPSLTGSALRIAFHPVNPAETALWTHGFPHKGERARVLGPKGHLALMNLMNLAAVGGPK